MKGKRFFRGLPKGVSCLGTTRPIIFLIERLARKDFIRKIPVIFGPDWHESADRFHESGEELT
jgi:hypothetical protein